MTVAARPHRRRTARPPRPGPRSVTRATLKQYRHSDAVTDIIGFPDRGHSLTIDSGWREVADTVLGWLRRQTLEARR